MMSMLKKIVLFPISLFVAILALMARWLLTLSSYVVAPLMFIVGISSTLPSTSTLRRTLKGMMQQPAEKTGGKHSFLKMV